MEVQLEEEYEDKQKVLRERRELEAKLLTAQDQVYDGTYEHLLLPFFLFMYRCKKCIVLVLYFLPVLPVSDFM